MHERQRPRPAHPGGRDLRPRRHARRYRPDPDRGLEPDLRGSRDRPTRDALAPLIGVDGKRLAREIAALAGQPIDDGRAEEIDKRSGEIYEHLNSDPKPLPGVRALIDAIEARGLRWSIATSSRKDQVQTSVKALGLDAEPSIVDASHVEHAKPEPDLLLRAAEELEVEPGRCWYVGDSTWDMVAAVAAGMLPIGVTAGAAVDEQALRGAGAAAVVRTLDEIADALRPTWPAEN